MSSGICCAAGTGGPLLGVHAALKWSLSPKEGVLALTENRPTRCGKIPGAAWALPTRLLCWYHRLNTLPGPASKRGHEDVRRGNVFRFAQGNSSTMYGAAIQPEIA